MCVQPATAAVNVTLLAFAAESRAAVRHAAAAPLLRDTRRLQHDGRAAIDRYRLPAANPPHVAAALDGWDRHRDRRTPDRYIDPAAYRSIQPCIPPGSLNRVPASAGVKAGVSPLPGGR